MTDTSTTTATDLDGFDFSGSGGAEAAREAFKAAQTGYDRLDFLTIDGSPAAVASGTNFAILRFLSDHAALPDGSLTPWLTVDQHSMVPTKPKPANHEGSWPASMSAICRNDKIFARRYGDCYIDTLPPATGKKTRRPSPRTWATAVLREEVMGDGSPELGGPEMLGKVVGVRDQTKEVVVTGPDGKPTGESKTAKCYVKVNQGWKNFFAPLAGIAGRNRTILDRDIYISREGMDQNNTVYTPMALDPIVFPPSHKFAGQTFDLRSAEQRAEFYPDMPDLKKIVAEQASNAFYNRFFVPNDRLYGNGEGVTDVAAVATSDGTPVPAQTPSAPPTEQAVPVADRLAALKERVSGGSTTNAAAPTTDSPPVQAVSEGTEQSEPSAAAPAEESSGLAL